MLINEQKFGGEKMTEDENHLESGLYNIQIWIYVKEVCFRLMVET